MNDALLQAPLRSAAELRVAATAAMERGAFAQALDLWQHLRDQHTDQPVGYAGGIAALQALRRYEEAGSLATEGLCRFPGNTGLLSARATLAAAQRDWPRAEQEWEALLLVAPGQENALVGLAYALVARGKTHAAEATLEKARLAAPDSFTLRVAQAEIAGRAQSWALAEQRWRALHDEFPDRPQPVQGLAESLLQQKSFDAAETLLGASVAAFPDSRAMAEAYARAAVARGDWSGAERRWSAVSERFPHSFLAWHGVAFARLKCGDLEGADDIAHQALDLFPAQPTLLSVLAMIAGERRQWPEAERRWEALRLALPSHVDAWLRQAEALRAQGKQAETAALLLQAGHLFPGETRILHARAELAIVLEQWPEAAELLHAQLAANPQDRRLQDRAFVASWRSLGRLDAPPFAQNQPPIASPAKSEDRELMLRFESFGTDTEFGMVQRYFGAEPQALLRWAEIPADRLAAAVTDSFEGIGDPENLRLSLGGDYKVRDRLHGITFHTFVKEEQTDRDVFFTSQCKRTQFLRREFLDELSEAAKIFVYKSSSFDPMPEVLRLHAAMQRHGTATLFYVRLGDAEHPGGTVERVAPGLVVGYLSSIYDGRNTPTIAHACWSELCQKALALVDETDLSVIAARKPREIMLRFESMGNNCELGLVQRGAGAEPLGLLRWTVTTLPGLAKAIETDFAGVGDPANTELLLTDEYRATDPRYGLAMRTFVRADQATMRDLHAEQGRRMRLLRDRLLADLKSGARIFVHKTAQATPLDEVVSLHAAMRRHGPAMLLHVRPPDKDHPDGTIGKLAPGLLVGYLDKLVSVGAGWSIAYSSWRTLCASALREIDQQTG